MSGLVITSAGAVTTLQINRADRANALDPDLIRELSDAMVAAERDENTRALVLTAAGERHFCSGLDVKAALAAEEKGASLTNGIDPTRRPLFEILAELEIPTIAAVNGAAVGIGFELVLACDLAIADSTARFGCPEAKRGMAAQYASVILPRRMATSLALDMLLSGELIDAAEAYRRQIILSVTEPGQAYAAACARAHIIAANAPLSLKRIKRTARRTREMPLVAAIRLDESPDCYASEDRIEGFRAFVEKRAPHWKGR